MTYLFLTPVLAAGTVTDLRFRKVPNGVIGFGAAAGLAILTAERLSGDVPQIFWLFYKLEKETAVQLELFSLVMPGWESGSGCPCAADMY